MKFEIPKLKQKYLHSWFQADAVYHATHSKEFCHQPNQQKQRDFQREEFAQDGWAISIRWQKNPLPCVTLMYRDDSHTRRGHVMKSTMPIANIITNQGKNYESGIVVRASRCTVDNIIGWRTWKKSNTRWMLLPMLLVRAPLTPMFW